MQLLQKPLLTLCLKIADPDETEFRTGPHAFLMCDVG